MQTNPIFQFENTSSTGINEVPINGIVHINDYDGNGTPNQVLKIALGTLDSSSTIQDFLNDTTLYHKISTIFINDLSDVDTSTTAPSNGQILKWDGSNWVSADDEDTTYTAGTGLALNGTEFSLNAGIDLLTDVDTSTTAPSNGQVLKWDGSNWAPADDDSGTTINSLNDIGDVNVPSPSDKDVLRYDNANSEWINDSNYARTDSANTFTGPQKTSITVANNGTFDLSLTNDFKCTPTADVTLDFSNISGAAGQGGNIIFENTNDYNVTVSNSSIKKPTTLEGDLSTTGTYLLSYYTDGSIVILLNSVPVS